LPGCAEIRTSTIIEVSNQISFTKKPNVFHFMLYCAKKRTKKAERRSPA
jgi:hypothetical protein